MTMTVSSFRLEDSFSCSPSHLQPQDRVMVVLKGQTSPSITKTKIKYEMSDEFLESAAAAAAKIKYEMSEEFLESAAATVVMQCGDNQGVLDMNPDYSSDGGEVGVVGVGVGRDFGGGSETSEDDGSSSPHLIKGSFLSSSIKSWCEETGLPAAITVHFKDRTFQLHEFPLISRSGYFKTKLLDAEEITMPDECPGTSEIFEIVASFCYGSPLQMEPANVADLRCMAEFLLMTEDHGRVNLCERSNGYLNQVALQSWQDTMVVLLRCPNLLPYAEDLGIVNGCIECLAFLACIEMVDPQEKTSRPGAASIESQFWSDISVSTGGTGTTTDSSPSSPDWWMDDLLRLPCGLFERVIGAIRREGMQEKFVSRAIVKFVDRWVFTSASPDPDDPIIIIAEKCATLCTSKKGHKNGDNLVEAVVRLLPDEKDAVPINFLFSLLRCALACNSSPHCRSQLESRIACQLELATISDFLYPFKASEVGCISAAEVSCMRRIVNTFMNLQRSYSEPSEVLPPSVSSHEVPENYYCAYAVSAVAKVWDEYLTEVARDLTLTPAKFAELAEVVPSYARATHDHLYRAIHVYLKVHPHFTPEERQMVCGILNCQKLSPEMCSHAVQNELMPLRMIVQAMFMQQLQTRNALSGHLQYTGQSARFDALTSQALASLTNGAASWRRSSFGAPNRISTTTDSFRSSRESFRSKNDYFRDDSFGGDDDIDEDDTSGPLGIMMKREAAFRQAQLLKADYEATESRLQNLEEELAFMKKKMGRKKQHPVSKCTSERFSSASVPTAAPAAPAAAGGGGGKKKKKETLNSVPEAAVAAATTSDIEDDDHNGAGVVKYSARSGNGMGFLTRALRLITLGSFGRRKAIAAGGGEGAVSGGADAATPGEAEDEEDEEAMNSVHMLCGGRGMWRNNDDSINIVVTRPKKEKPSSTLNSIVAHGSGLCSAEIAKKTRHNRRHSLS